MSIWLRLFVITGCFYEFLSSRNATPLFVAFIVFSLMMIDFAKMAIATAKHVKTYKVPILFAMEQLAITESMEELRKLSDNEREMMLRVLVTAAIEFEAVTKRDPVELLDRLRNGPKVAS